MRSSNKQSKESRRQDKNELPDLSSRRAIGYRLWAVCILLPPLAIWVAIFLAYSNALVGPFCFDDSFTILDNKSIRSLWPLWQSFWAPQDAPTAGRPVVNFSFALNYVAGQQNVFGYHLVNVVLHCLNTALLYALVYRTLAMSNWGQAQPIFAWGVSIAVAALWALHPIQTETVSYVTQRTELMMALFFLGTMYAARRAWDAHSRVSRIAWQLSAVVSCGLGMASKEVMVVAPIMVLLYDRMVMKASFASLIKSRIPLYVGLATTWAILAALMATNPRGKSVGFGLNMEPFDYLTTQFWAITHYLWLAIWPIGLCADYGIFVVTEPRIWLPRLLVLLVLVGLILWAWLRNNAFAFLGAWFFLILAPTSSIVPIVTEPVAERRMYLPLAAVVVFVVLGGMISLDRLTIGNPARNKSWSKTGAWLFMFLTVILFGLYAWATYARNEVYRSEVAFWQDVIEKRPDNSRGFSNLGVIYHKNKQLESAVMSYRQAIELAPTNAYALCDLGKVYFDQGNQDEALAYYNRALTVNPSMPKALYRRGLLLSNQMRWAEAIEDFHLALDLDPNSAETRFQLGNIYLAQKQYSPAIDEYRAAIALDPSFCGAYHNLGAALARTGGFREAIDLFEKAEKLEPMNVDAYHNLGHCYAALGEFTKATEAYQRCVSIKPEDAHAWYRLGKAFVSSGKASEGRRCFLRVLELDPNADEARQQLKQLGEQ